MSKRSKKYPLPQGLAGVADLEREREKRLRRQRPWPNPADVAMGGRLADYIRGSRESEAEDAERRAEEAEADAERFNAAADFESAKLAQMRAETYRQVAARKRGVDPEFERRAEFERRDARRAVESMGEAGSAIYNDSSPYSWVQDVALVQAANLSKYPLAWFGPGTESLRAAQAVGRDQNWAHFGSAAEKRLSAYSKELRAHILAGTPTGERALASYRSQLRLQGYNMPGEVEAKESELMSRLYESRDAQTSMTDMSYFVTPVVDNQVFQIARTNAAPLASSARQFPLPVYGNAVLMPALGTTLGAAVQAEGSGLWLPNTAVSVGFEIVAVSAQYVGNGDTYVQQLGGPPLFQVTTAGTTGATPPNWSTAPAVGDTVTDGSVVWTQVARPGLNILGTGTGSAPGWSGDNIFAPVGCVVAEVTMPQQVIDRENMGPSFTGLWMAQAARETATVLDSQLLSALLGTSALTQYTTAGTTLYSVGSLYTDVNAVATTLATKGNVVIQPNFLAGKPKLLRGFMSQLDSENRPVWLPDSGGQVVASSGPFEGDAGYSVAGLHAFFDQNLAAQETTSGMLLAGNPGRGAVVYTSEPIIQIFPEWSPAGLTALLRIYQYYAVAPLYNGAAFATISGSAVYGAAG